MKKIMSWHVITYILTTNHKRKVLKVHRVKNTVNITLEKGQSSINSARKTVYPCIEE